MSKQYQFNWVRIDFQNIRFGDQWWEVSAGDSTKYADLVNTFDSYDEAIKFVESNIDYNSLTDVTK